MPEIVKSSRGLVSFSANGKPDARIYCLPYAGGSASIFAGWRQALPANLEVCAIELPGRGPVFRTRADAHGCRRR